MGLSPKVSSRAVDEYMAVLDDAAFGAATEVTPKFISPADPARCPAAGLLRLLGQLPDRLDHAVIVDVEASTAVRQTEVKAAKTMIERADERFELYPERLAGDSACGSGEMLEWLVHERGIEPHVPVFDKTDGSFSRQDFTYDHQGDVYVCPAGKMLTCKGTVVNDNQLLYRARKHDCYACSLKPRCCPKEPARKVPRSIYEGARGPRHRQDRRLPHLTAAAEEGRNAV